MLVVCFRRILGENEVVGSGLLVFPAHHAKTDRLGYKEELRKQVCYYIFTEGCVLITY